MVVVAYRGRTVSILNNSVDMASAARRSKNRGFNRYKTRATRLQSCEITTFPGNFRHVNADNEQLQFFLIFACI